MLLLLGCGAYNLGTGRGTSVLQMVAAFEEASGKVFFYNLLYCNMYAFPNVLYCVLNPSFSSFLDLFSRKFLLKCVQGGPEMLLLSMHLRVRLKMNLVGSKYYYVSLGGREEGLLHSFN